MNKLDTGSILVVSPPRIWSLRLYACFLLHQPLSSVLAQPEYHYENTFCKLRYCILTSCIVLVYVRRLVSWWRYWFQLRLADYKATMDKLFLYMICPTILVVLCSYVPLAKVNTSYRRYLLCTFFSAKLVNVIMKNKSNHINACWLVTRLTQTSIPNS